MMWSQLQGGGYWTEFLFLVSQAFVGTDNTNVSYRDVRPVRDQSRTQAIRGWPGIRDWPGDGGPFAESATGLATIQKSKNYLSN